MANFKHKVFLLIAKWIPVAVAAGILINNTIEAEMFGLYKSQIDADFGLYKSQRDGFDVTNARVSELEKEVAVSKANTINGVTIGEGSIKVTIPFMNKTVIFDKDDFNELKTNIEKYGKSE